MTTGGPSNPRPPCHHSNPMNVQASALYHSDDIFLVRIEQDDYESQAENWGRLGPCERHLHKVQNKVGLGRAELVLC